MQTREPGAGSFGTAVRSLVLDPEQRPQSELAELFLFAADRAEHVHSLIQPALKRHQVVLCDRYCYSTEAFQGYGRGIDLTQLRTINSLAVQGTLPDVVILLDLPPEEGLRRNAREKGRETDSFEREHIEFHHALRDGFLTLAEERAEPFLVLDATKPPEVLLSEAIEMLTPYFERLAAR